MSLWDSITTSLEAFSHFPVGKVCDHDVQKYCNLLIKIHMTSVASLGECEELPNQLPKYMLLHPKLIFNAPGVSMEQFMDPHVTCEDWSVVGLSGKHPLCIENSPSTGKLASHPPLTPESGLKIFRKLWSLRTRSVNHWSVFGVYFWAVGTSWHSDDLSTPKLAVLYSCSATFFIFYFLCLLWRITNQIKTL